jgi:chemotaxis protein MotB
MPDEELEKQEAGAEPWMLTYGDMVTLLLTFFVLLFSFATIDVQKFREVVISLKGTLGVLTGGEQVLYPGDLPKADPESGQPVPAQELAQPAITESEDPGPEGEKSDVDTYQSGLGEVIATPNVVSFNQGAAEIEPEFAKYLDRLVPLIDFYKGNQVSIIGHTDPRPVFANSPYKSNWELASARAISVINYFVNQHGISEDRFSLTAYSEYRPLLDKSGEPREDSKQRRIDVIFHPKRTPSRFDTLQLSPE